MLDSRILVALTDSRAGLNAAEQAVKLAASTGSRLAAISVAPALEGDLDLLHFPDPQSAQDALAEPHKNALRQAKDLAARHGVGLETFLAFGQPHEKIVDRAEALDSTLIILGESRRGVVERAVLGPTAARVVGYARRDVLVIPEGSDLDFSRIVLATDGSANSRGAVSRAYELARAYGGRIICVGAVHVLPEYNIWGNVVDEMLAKARNNVDAVVQAGREMGLSIEGEVSQAEPAEAIIEAAARTKAGVIVMGSHGRTGLRRLLMGSVAESVLSRASCPTLLAP